mgnify:CR=1 FL=1
MKFYRRRIFIYVEEHTGVFDQTCALLYKEKLIYLMTIRVVNKIGKASNAILHYIKLSRLNRVASGACASPSAAFFCSSARSLSQSRLVSSFRIVDTKPKTDNIQLLRHIPATIHGQGEVKIELSA